MLQKFYQHCVDQLLPFLQDLRFVYCAFLEVFYQSGRGPDLDRQLRLAALGRPVVLVNNQNFLLLQGLLFILPFHQIALNQNKDQVLQ